MIATREDGPPVLQTSEAVVSPSYPADPSQRAGRRVLFGAHRQSLKPEYWQRVHLVNGSGCAVPRGMLGKGWRSAMTTPGQGFVQMNDDAVRSVEGLFVRRDRGRVNRLDRGQGKICWLRTDHHIDADLPVQRMIPALLAEMARLPAYPDVWTANARGLVCQWVKIAELMQHPDQRDLYDELTGERMGRSYLMRRQFWATLCSAGPPRRNRDARRSGTQTALYSPARRGDEPLMRAAERATDAARDRIVAGEFW